MSLQAFARNSIEAGVRYVPSFGWLLILPYSKGIALLTLIEYLAVASLFLFLTNISFDGALLYVSRKHQIYQRNVLALQALRTACVLSLLGFYGVLLHVTDRSPLAFEFLLVAALIFGQSIEVGDWYLRAIMQERLLLQVKAGVVAILAFPLAICAILGNWRAFHMAFVLTVFLLGTMPYLIYRLKGAGVSDQDLPALEGFSAFLLELLRIGKDFFLASAPNQVLRRITPLLFVKSGYDDVIIYSFFMLMRLLDAMTPLFVAGSNCLYRRWVDMSCRQRIKDYAKIQVTLFAFLAGIYVIYAALVEVFLPQYSFVLHAFFWMFVFVSLLSSRNALFLALEITTMVVRFNVLALIPLPFFLTLGPQVEYMRNGTLLYTSFLANSFVLTHFFLLGYWRRVR